MLAFHLDLKTIHYRRDYLAALFVRLAAAGYSHVVVEIEDKIALDCTRPAHWCEAWGKAEFAEVLTDIRRAGMTAVPLIQTLGHLEHLLSHSRFHPLRELRGSAYQACPSNPQTVAFMLRYMDEVIELFHAPPLIHLGADEAWSLGRCPQCAAAAGQSSLSQLFHQYMAPLFEHALDRGCRPIAWADVLLAHHDAIDRFSRDTIWMDWDYWTQDHGTQTARNWSSGKHGSVELLAEELRGKEISRFAFDADGAYRPWFYTDYLLSKGFEVIIAPASRCGGDHVFAPDIKHPGNVMSAVNRMHQSPRPAGLMVTSWALRLNPLETQWPSLYVPQAAAETGGQRWRELAGLITRKAFGRPLPEFIKAWEWIAPTFALAESHYAIEHDIHYNGEQDSIPVILDRLADRKEWADQRVRLERQLPGYEQGIGLIDQLDADLNHQSVPMKFWKFAARAIHARAQEQLLFMNSREGHQDRPLAEQYLLRLESLQDEYRDLLLRIATPASVHRELNMVFASSWRHLARLAAVRNVAPPPPPAVGLLTSST